MSPTQHVLEIFWRILPGIAAIIKQVRIFAALLDGCRGS
jgi:hypothetical protein